MTAHERDAEFKRIIDGLPREGLEKVLVLARKLKAERDQKHQENHKAH